MKGVKGDVGEGDEREGGKVWGGEEEGVGVRLVLSVYYKSKTSYVRLMATIIGTSTS